MPDSTADGRDIVPLGSCSVPGLEVADASLLIHAAVSSAARIVPLDAVPFAFRRRYSASVEHRSKLTRRSCRASCVGSGGITSRRRAVAHADVHHIQESSGGR